MLPQERGERILNKTRLQLFLAFQRLPRWDSSISRVWTSTRRLPYCHHRMPYLPVKMLPEKLITTKYRLGYVHVFVKAGITDLFIPISFPSTIRKVTGTGDGWRKKSKNWCKVKGQEKNSCKEEGKEKKSHAPAEKTLHKQWTKKIMHTGWESPPPPPHHQPSFF